MRGRGKSQSRQSVNRAQQLIRHSSSKSYSHMVGLVYSMQTSPRTLFPSTLFAIMLWTRAPPQAGHDLHYLILRAETTRGEIYLIVRALTLFVLSKWNPYSTACTIAPRATAVCIARAAKSECNLQAQAIARRGSRRQEHSSEQHTKLKEATMASRSPQMGTRSNQ